MSPASQVLQDLSPDDPLYDVIKRQTLEQVPDHGAIIGWALGTFHREGKDEFIIRPGNKIGLVFPPRTRGPSRATTTTRWSATSRAA